MTDNWTAERILKELKPVTLDAETRERQMAIYAESASVWSGMSYECVVIDSPWAHWLDRVRRSRIKGRKRTKWNNRQTRILRKMEQLHIAGHTEPGTWGHIRLLNLEANYLRTLSLQIDGKSR